jgi:LmbE family N-acetylglucosaminyl deacetylase
MSDAVAVILSPHYDDAVLGLGGMLAQRKARGEGSFVVTIFGGKAPPALDLTWWNKGTGFPTNAEAEAHRMKENRNALNLLGLDDHHIVDVLFNDAQYRNEKDAEAEARLAQAVKDQITAVLSRFGGQRASIYAPMSNGWGHLWQDSHPDHAVVHQAFIEIFRSGRFPAAAFNLYEDVVPYVNRFTHDRAKEWVEQKDRVRLEQVVIQLWESDYSSKLASLNQYASQLNQFGEPVDTTLMGYSSQLCSSLNLTCYACEIVYKIFSDEA